MACSNCFNGCAEIVSDQCVKYTGEDVPALGISNGDTVSAVENAIITNLISVMNGTGIKFDISEADMCTVVRNYLPTCCADLTLVDVITALVKATCQIEAYVVGLANSFSSLESSYNVGCLSVSGNSGTHSVLQATIDFLCSVNANLAALALDVSTNYVKIEDINSYIEAYINGSSSTLIKNKMVPYTVVEYYGPLSNFDISGAGIGDWVDIYLCNGQNGTPDKRGRVGVGATTMGSTPFNSAVDPAIAGNPTYAIGATAGANTVTLSVSEIPSHTHSATSTATSTDHFHYMVNTAGGGTLSTTTPLADNFDGAGDDDYQLKGATSGTANLGRTSSSKSDVTVSTTVAATGGGLGHSNIQPVLACYYIMYIP